MPMITRKPSLPVDVRQPVAGVTPPVIPSPAKVECDLMKHIFGPVPSRRLGRSLGIDLVPFKTCSYDCLYCQLGKTTLKTLERRNWVSIEDVLRELEQKLEQKPDFITLSGSGEPTLHSRIGTLIDQIKVMTKIPVAVLTNGSMLWQPKVRKEILRADRVIPSLDAGNEKLFQLVNRPHPELTFEQVLDGLVDFRTEYHGDYWLEVLLLDSYTGNIEQTKQIARCVDKIKPDKVQLNTVVRPPAEESAKTVSKSTMGTLAEAFGCEKEVIADFSALHNAQEFQSESQSVFETLRRRPCTSGDIAQGLGMHPNEVVKYVRELLESNAIEQYRTQGKIYYRTKQSSE